MLKDITLGQFFPGTSIVHRLDPRCKLLMTVVYIAALFTAENYVSYAAMLVVTGVCIALSRIPLKVILRGLKPLWIIIALTAVLNMFFTPGRELVSFWKITITYEGLVRAVFMVLRITMLIAGTFLLTYTTSPIALTDAMEILFGPLKKLKVPVHEMSMMMSMALRFIPKFKAQMQVVSEAQACIGRDTKNGSVFQRVGNAVKIFSIMVTWSLENAIETADSMRSRGYGLPGRTAFSIYRFDERDKAALAWLIFCGTYLVSGWMAGGTYFRYYPTVKSVVLTPMTVSFMCVYLALVLTPVILDRKEDRQWNSLQSTI